MFDRSGFAGTAVDYDSGTVTPRWAGEVPADVRAMAADPAPGVTVNLVAAQYSEKELAAAGRAVVDGDGEDLSGQPEVLYAMPLEDRSGLTTVLAEDVQGYPSPGGGARPERTL